MKQKEEERRRKEELKEKAKQVIVVTNGTPKDLSVYRMHYIRIEQGGIIVHSRLRLSNMVVLIGCMFNGYICIKGNELLIFLARYNAILLFLT